MLSRHDQRGSFTIRRKVNQNHQEEQESVADGAGAAREYVAGLPDWPWDRKEGAVRHDAYPDCPCAWSQSAWLLSRFSLHGRNQREEPNQRRDNGTFETALARGVDTFLLWLRKQAGAMIFVCLNQSAPGGRRRAHLPPADKADKAPQKQLQNFLYTLCIFILTFRGWYGYSHVELRLFFRKIPGLWLGQQWANKDLPRLSPRKRPIVKKKEISTALSAVVAGERPIIWFHML